MKETTPAFWFASPGGVVGPASSDQHGHMRSVHSVTELIERRRPTCGPERLLEVQRRGSAIAMHALVFLGLQSGEELQHKYVHVRPK